MQISCVLFVVGIFCLKTSTADIESAKAIQIIAPVNHSFHLKDEELRPILENENIKDRYVAVISIAGAFRQGKSFLLNFFLKYLYAQYKTHNITDWIGETAAATELQGFKWRAGRKRETIGIWMWSDIFTHDYANGEKVAIILIDTQGVFDDQSSVKDYTTIFALSMMLSSLQCFNLMQNIKEDDLQHLELFTEYGRLAFEQSNEKPFQKLLFLVRDWPYAFENGYGFAQNVIDETLTESDSQTAEMRQLRQRIRSSYKQISAFLMPHPGMIVAQSNEFTGNLSQIAPEFIKHVKDLVPALFAPENLIVRTINGQKVRARDLLQYLQAYVQTFSGDAVPEPKTILSATAEASNLILFNDCMQFYEESMTKSVESVDPYYKENQIIEIHQKIRGETVSKFLEKPKLGGAELTTRFQHKIEDTAEERFKWFKSKNDQKRNAFIEKANFHNGQLAREMLDKVKRRVLEEADHPIPDAVHAHLHNIFNAEKETALNEFNSRKMGDDEISNGSRAKLEQDLNNYQSVLSQTLDSFNHCRNEYSRRMQESLNGVEYFSLNEFMTAHQNIRNEVIAQFQTQPIEIELKFKLQQKMEKTIDERFPQFESQHVAKRHSFREASRSIEYGTASAWRWPIARATCPPGKRLTGGGGACKSLAGKGWCFLYQNRPENEVQWIVNCDTPEQQNVQAEAWANCVAILR